ncbi:hypothetical protein SAMN04489759_108141 [Sulfitobacter delicatus]|uniref:Uncharacterized protein n=1 Tax=Sulfitobacter delicatus TaxID=218672 RepID=A0A1G7UX01_9RHOB|nr:hypothetical protein SAMN04489759_108141 [Sulfitobacter delicatus]
MLYETSAPLAGERLRPLGHVSADPFREGSLGKQGQNGSIIGNLKNFETERF